MYVATGSYGFVEGDNPNAQQGGPCPIGTIGIWPLCVPVVTQGGPPTTGPPTTQPTGCPPGTIGTAPPFCVPIPATLPPVPASTCPKGTYGTAPPFCVPVPATLPTVPAGGECPSGQIWTPYGCGPAVPSLPSWLPVDAPQAADEPPGALPPPAAPEGWWAKRTTIEKVGIVAGGGIVALLLLRALTKGAALKPNRRRRRSSRRRSRASLSGRARRGVRARRRGRVRRRYATNYVKPRTRTPRPRQAGGKIIAVGKGKSRRTFGRRFPPSKYRRLGFLRKKDYAWPEGYQYPVGDYKHCRAALVRFSRWKSDYPLYVRRTIASNLNKCKKRFGIGGPPVKP